MGDFEWNLISLPAKEQREKQKERGERVRERSRDPPRGGRA